MNIYRSIICYKLQSIVEQMWVGTITIVRKKKKEKKVEPSNRVQILDKAIYTHWLNV